MGVLKVVAYLLLVIACVIALGHSYSTGKKVNPREQCPSCVASACEATMYANYPGDCEKFCRCDDLTALECPIGLHFNADLGVCDWPSPETCLVEDTYIGSCTPP